ncbi:MAG: glycosyltransferase family 4 protein [Chromatiales bacterium]|nr:glycosyltransferase family 4 protein [Chromatiales bacterium]
MMVNAAGLTRIWVKGELSDRGHLTGYTDCPEQYLAIADVMCLPSYREGFGTVVIEAAAMGVPTVGTAINGLCDAVQDNKTGLLVKPRNAEALFHGLREIFSQPGLLARLGSAAHVYASTNFCVNHISRKLMTEYEKRLTCRNEIQKRAQSVLRD